MSSYAFDENSANLFISSILDQFKEENLNSSKRSNDEINTIKGKEINYPLIEYKTLGEVCKFKCGQNKLDDKIYEDPFEKSIYPVYNTTSYIGYIERSNIPKESIIIKKTGYDAGYFFKIGSDSWLLHGFSLTYQNEKNNDYVFYYLQFQQSRICRRKEEGGVQTINPTKRKYDFIQVKRSDFEKIKIPIVSPEHEKRIIDFLNDKTGQNYELLQKLVNEFENIDLFKFLLYEDYDTIKKAISIIIEDFSSDIIEKIKKEIKLKYQNLIKDNIQYDSNNSILNIDGTFINIPTRKRGRPRRNNVIINIPDSPKRKRGRPKKIENLIYS